MHFTALFASLAARRFNQTAYERASLLKGITRRVPASPFNPCPTVFRRMQPPAIFLDTSAFSEAFLPPVFANREQEFSRLRKCLAPLVQRKPTRNVWLHGPPGSGKTSIAKFLLNELEDRHGIRGAYVNCWETETFYSVLDKLVRDFRILGAERLSTLYKMERLETFLQGRPFLVVLDEIDKPSPKERDAIIYNLCGVPYVSLICVCNSRYFYYSLDSRVRSRLDAALIEFRPYSLDQLEEILQQRAEAGLGAETQNPWLFRKIAEHANGDARVAIQTLRNAAVQAGGSERIETRHLTAAETQARSSKRKYLLAKLTDHHRLLYEVIQEAGEINSRQLWEEYLKRCRQKRIRSAAARTFSLYLRQIAESELISYRRALGVKGNIRIFQVRQ